MSREAHVRFWESAGVQLPRATHLPLDGQAVFESGDGAEQAILDVAAGFERAMEDLDHPALHVPVERSRNCARSRVDAHTGRAGMSAEERLACHQRQSGPRMAALKTWLDGQLAERRVEPNSGAGDAIRYMLRHWERLTLFLRAPGAPLDNNICERALKTAILHRKNALFYKTQNGARVGDLYMSLIHSAELARADPFDYLLQLLGHRAAVAAAPSEWMPWNYRETLAGRATRAP